MSWEIEGSSLRNEHKTGIIGYVYYDILNDVFKVVIRQKNRSIWYRDAAEVGDGLLDEAKKRADEKLIELLTENKDENTDRKSVV